jgi:hypothetical protein
MSRKVDEEFCPRAASFYEIRPVFPPSGHPEDVQIRSRRICGYFILSCRPYLQDKYGTALAGPKGELHGCNS